MLAVVEGRASEDERLDVVDHVMACPLCRRDFEALRAVVRAGERLGAEDAAAGSAPAPRARRAIPWPPLAAAAAVVVLLGANLVWQRVARRDAGPEPMRGAPADAGSGVAAVAPLGAVPVAPTA